MYRIDTSTAVTSKPAKQPAGNPGFFAQGNPSAGIPFTTTSPDWGNTIQEEITNVILQAGIGLSKSDDTQLFQAIQNLISAGGQGASSGVATLQQQLSAILARLANFRVFQNFYSTDHSTTFVVPSNCYEAEVWMVGGGGSGGNCNGVGTTAGNISAGGGGGAAMVYGVMNAANGFVPGASLPIIVGVGGSSASFSDGTATQFNGWEAKGGGKGQSGGDRGSAGGAGGKTTLPLATGQVWAIQGQDGSDGQSAGLVFAGNGGNSFFGGGGRAGNLQGTDGHSWGAGGGGAYDSTNSATTRYGGNGQGGAVWLKYLTWTL